MVANEPSYLINTCTTGAYPWEASNDKKSKDRGEVHVLWAGLKVLVDGEGDGQLPRRSLGEKEETLSTHCSTRKVRSENTQANFLKNQASPTSRRTQQVYYTNSCSLAVQSILYTHFSYFLRNFAPIANRN